MPRIPSVTLEVPTVAVATDFYASAFGLGSQLRLRACDAPTNGFRGFTLSLVVNEPTTVNALVEAAIDAGAISLKPAKKQFWGGYSGVVQAPDGTIWKVATSAKKDAGPATRHIEGIVLVLGVADMARSKQFYVDRGFTVAKSYGSKYVEFDAPANAVKLALYKRGGLAKDAGVAAEGAGSHRLAIGSDAGSFLDPDEFAWEPSPVVAGNETASSPLG